MGRATEYYPQNYPNFTLRSGAINRILSAELPELYNPILPVPKTAPWEYQAFFES